MSNPSPAMPDKDDTLDEQLVAYLDGELSAEEAFGVEQRLAHDPEARQRLRRLQSAWDLLDDLPRADVDLNFTQTTVSMIAVRSRDEEALAGGGVLRRVVVWMMAVAGMFLAGAMGYWTVETISSADDRQLLQDLPVLEKLDMYQSAESLEFLRKLAQAGVFDEEPSDEF
jgi:anti-sigma factor RsiW